eukprot:CAMPEP_0115242940 /NCGR_PEP_ID=MMETSP0270-20121206/39213_1 /TAXON_ID=71861 /ORGANISM="Scrippsiella trochoidea, Strain CCMP3099" /LENGTH=98 /DNA_ID=CAMNT_0002658025 /DNA_START=581 /DNA_END=872 /DNA_ORIENTATION=-
MTPPYQQSPHRRKSTTGAGGLPALVACGFVRNHRSRRAEMRSVVFHRNDGTASPPMMSTMGAQGSSLSSFPRADVWLTRRAKVSVPMAAHRATAVGMV